MGNEENKPHKKRWGQQVLQPSLLCPVSAAMGNFQCCKALLSEVHANSTSPGLYCKSAVLLLWFYCLVLCLKNPVRLLAKYIVQVQILAVPPKKCWPRKHHFWYMPCTGVEMSQKTGKSPDQESPVIAKVICREYMEVSDMISLLSVTGLLVISIQWYRDTVSL